MLEYQEKYINNVREIARLSVFYRDSENGFEAWKEARKQSVKRIDQLREENIALLSEGLFPVLDDLYSASSQTIDELSEFAAVLMDWKTNLDCGIYMVIHEARLKLNSVKKNREGIIRELYMLGMGLYFLRRFPSGVECEENNRYAFRNEMIFTEAASYLRYFEEIKDEQTRGYIIRALHNISLCATDRRRRIASNARALNVMHDEYYRSLAPGLPWDAFIRASHQQMSTNRSDISSEDLTREELALVLDSCYEVFRPETSSENRNVRWMWPYYDMEYACGYADLETTVSRMEELIDSIPYDQYDVSGLYANVQLPLYYGRYMQKNPQLQTDEDSVRFLDKANRKMLKVLLTCPMDRFDDYFFYNVDAAISNFYEIEGSLTYKELAEKISRRFSGTLYIRSRKAGDIMRIFCEYILKRDPSFFDDIPFIANESDPEKKGARLLEYAGECGLLMDFGSIKMNIQRTVSTRQLLDIEDEMHNLHTVSGGDDLRARRSTEVYADIALGHHSWYNGSGGYPSGYVRTDSPYRQMTDIAAIVSWMLSNWDGDMPGLIKNVLSCPHGQFSPVAAAYLSDQALANDIERILGGDDTEYYREIYQELMQ